MASCFLLLLRSESFPGSVAREKLKTFMTFNATARTASSVSFPHCLGVVVNKHGVEPEERRDVKELVQMQINCAVKGMLRD